MICHPMTDHAYRIRRAREGAVLALDVHDADSLAAAVTLRRRIAMSLASAPGLCFAKPLTTLGSARSGGFGPGVPALHRQVVISVWRDLASVAEPPIGDATHAWRVVARVTRTRGSFHGENPFDPAPAEGHSFAALTLGRCAPGALVRFMWRGMGLAERTLGAPGLITALSAGLPQTGNITFSLWDTEEDMVRFAYGGAGPTHRETVRSHRRRPILSEQLNARFVPISVGGSWDPETTPGADRLAALARQLAPA